MKDYFIPPDAITKAPGLAPELQVLRAARDYLLETCAIATGPRDVSMTAVGAALIADNRRLAQDLAQAIDLLEQAEAEAQRQEYPAMGDLIRQEACTSALSMTVAAVEALKARTQTSPTN